MTGFTFNNRHSGEVGVFFRSVDRSVRPEKRSYAYTVPGRSGAYRIEDGTWEERVIRCRLSFTGQERTRESLRERVRDVAAWLSGTGTLVFDDEPKAAYRATVLESISLEQIASAGFCDVQFLCEPFARSAEGRAAAATAVTLPQVLTLQSEGTAPADCRITVTAKEDIDDLYINLMYTI